MGVILGTNYNRKTNSYQAEADREPQVVKPAASEPVQTGEVNIAFQKDANETIDQYNTRVKSLYSKPTTESTGYVPRYVKPEDYKNSLPDTQDVERDIMKDAQEEINNLERYYNSRLTDELSDQGLINTKNDRSTASINTLTGLAGSTEANVKQQETTRLGQQANSRIRERVTSELATRVSSVLSQARNFARTEARALRDEARQDTRLNEEMRLSRKNEAQGFASALAQSGATVEGLRQTDPESYEALARNVGGEDMLKALFTLNRPQDQILDRKIESGKYIITYQNPITGDVRIETVDLGLPPQYTRTIDAGNRLLAIPDNWSGDPSELVTINKGLTPSQQSSSSPNSPQEERGLSINQIDLVRRNYGFTPKPWMTMSQIEQFVRDNPGASPEELQAAIDSIDGQGAQQSPLATQDDVKSAIQTARDAGYTDEQIQQYIKNKYGVDVETGGDDYNFLERAAIKVYEKANKLFNKVSSNENLQNLAIRTKLHLDEVNRKAADQMTYEDEEAEYLAQGYPPEEALQMAIDDYFEEAPIVLGVGGMQSVVPQQLVHSFVQNAGLGAKAHGSEKIAHALSKIDPNAVKSWTQLQKAVANLGDDVLRNVDVQNWLKTAKLMFQNYNLPI